MRGCILEDNTCHGYAGALSIWNSHADVVECSVRSNTVTVAGAVEVKDFSNWIASDSEFNDNLATTGSGGALVITEDSTATIEDCVFRGNASGFGGGAIFSAAAFVLTGSSLHDNTAIQDGGVAAVIEVEAGELVEADHAIEPARGGGREALGEIQVDPVIGVGADRQQDDRAGRPVERPFVFRREDRDIVAARHQDAGKPDAIALESPFRKKLDDSNGYSHR